MYSARITRTNKTAFVILCDLSGSMAEQVHLNGATMKKSEAVAMIINMLIEELINRSRRDTGLMDYFDIAVLGYSGNGVASMLSDDGKFTSITELARYPVNMQKHHILRNLPSGSQISATVDRKCWIEASANGDTPMCAALIKAEKLLREWCGASANADSFPPILINITDGEASDGDQHDISETSGRIRDISTKDGNVLFFNIHLTSSYETRNTLCFPGCNEALPENKYAKLLYEISSTLPECYNDLISPSNLHAAPPFRAISYNCHIDRLSSMLAMGTVSSAFTI